MGVSVEINDSIVEDAACLRKIKNDYNHIHVTKFDATIKSVNLALK